MDEAGPVVEAGAAILHGLYANPPVQAERPSAASA